MRRLTFTLVISLLAGACRPAAPATPIGRLPVLATFSLLGDLVQSVGGEHVSVRVLAGPGVDTHTFAPTAADGVALANARLVFEIGLDFETWLDDLYLASGSHATRTVVTEGITVIEVEESHAAGDHAAEGEAAGEDEHAHGTRDPHVWHSAANAILMARNIRDALIQADPANAAAYRANADAYTVQLQELDDWIIAQVSTLPPERRKLVTTHDTFAYFAQRYGFEVVGTLLPTSTEGASPSAQELAALVQAIRAAGVPAVFAESITSNSLLNQVATEAGVRVISTLYTDALGPPGSGAATYLEVMRHNVTAIVGALGS
jgi:ABC-type Zn uptake system ZnuABC Zn-binding protein ZnuA